jgi:hypothetical protein
MAKAELKVEQKQVISYTYTDTVQLTLDTEEARFLRDLMGMVGGSQTNSRRRHADAIIDALSNAGIHSSITDECMNHEDVQGQASIYFKDTK